MVGNKSAWWSKMIDKHGSEEAVRQFMRSNQQKSMLNPARQKGNHKGGFYGKSELAKKMSKKALKVRWKDKSNDSINPVGTSL